MVNIGKKRIGPLDPIDECSGDKAIKRPNANSYQDISGSFLPINESWTSWMGSCAFQNQQAEPWFLEPGERMSVSDPIAAQWQNRRGWIPFDKVEALFSKPGVYSIKYTCRVAGSTVLYVEKQPDPEVVVESTLDIVVREPKGDDKIVCDLLAKNPVLAATLMMAINIPPDLYGKPVPDPAVIPAIKNIIEKHPKSSYADYAHFALARWHLTQNKNADAIAELELIQAHDWAYQPNVLVMLRKLLEAGDLLKDSPKLKEIDAIMNRRHPDAGEWLEKYAELKSAKQGVDEEQNVDAWKVEWKAFRKRAPENDNKKPPAK